MENELTRPNSFVPFVIVVGIDYAEVSYLAFREACRQASHRAPSELHVVLVTRLTLAPVHLEGHPGESAPPRTEQLRRLRDWLATEMTANMDIASDIRSIPSAHVSCVACSDDVCSLASELNADLVVVGANASNAWAMKVAEDSACSVLVVRSPSSR